MPLSEEEQRVFDEIERRLVAQRPGRATRRRAPSPAAGGAAPAIALVGALLFTAVATAVHPLLVVVGFLGVLVTTATLLQQLFGASVHAHDGDRRH